MELESRTTLGLRTRPVQLKKVGPQDTHVTRECRATAGPENCAAMESRVTGCPRSQRNRQLGSSSQASRAWLLKEQIPVTVIRDKLS